MIRRSTEYGTALIEYTLTRSARRTLSISVHADGVSVVAPEGADVSTIDERVRRRARWILRRSACLPGINQKRRQGHSSEAKPIGTSDGSIG